MDAILDAMLADGLCPVCAPTFALLYQRFCGVLALVLVNVVEHPEQYASGTGRALAELARAEVCALCRPLPAPVPSGADRDLLGDGRR